MKKSQLENLIRAELSKMLKEGVTRAESFPGANALVEAHKLCKEALDPRAVGVKGQTELPPATKASFERILELLNVAFEAQRAARKGGQ